MKSCTDITRRDLLKAGLATLATAYLPGCAVFATKTVQDALKPENYLELTKGWDPVFGPDYLIFPPYGGKADFAGHQRGGVWGPGVDYGVDVGTPLVPVGASFLLAAGYTSTAQAGLMIDAKLISASAAFNLLHLHDIMSEQMNTRDSRIGFTGKPIRVMERNEIIALSGSTGRGPYYGSQPPHLHLTLWQKFPTFIDPEKYGIDSGRLTFWDGKTDFDMPVHKRPQHLEEVLQNFEANLASWQDQELAGKLLEYRKLMGDVKATKALGSKHFHDLRALLKRTVLEEKKYLPGTEPYAMMLKILGYSSNQPVILTLPFIAPPLLDKGIYRKYVYNEGPFYVFKNKAFEKVSSK